MRLLQPYLFGIIKDQCAEVEASNRFPVVTSLHSIIGKVREDVNATLAELEAEGLISHCLNINKIPLYGTPKQIKDATKR